MLRIKISVFRHVYESCATMQEIADMFGCSKETVKNIARKLGYPPRRPGRARLDMDAVIEMFKSGASYKAIAERFGVSVSGVGQALNRVGIWRYKRGM